MRKGRKSPIGKLPALMLFCFAVCGDELLLKDFGERGGMGIGVVGAPEGAAAALKLIIAAQQRPLHDGCAELGRQFALFGEQKALVLEHHQPCLAQRRGEDEIAAKTDHVALILQLALPLRL